MSESNPSSLKFDLSMRSLIENEMLLKHLSFSALIWIWENSAIPSTITALTKTQIRTVIFV